MRRELAIVAVLVSAAAAVGKDASGAAELSQRLVYLSTNLLVDENVTKAVALLERAAGAGYTGVVLTDSKFLRWDTLPERYVRNVAAVRDACRRLKLQCIVGARAKARGTARGGAWTRTSSS